MTAPCGLKKCNCGHTIEKLVKAVDYLNRAMAAFARDLRVIAAMHGEHRDTALRVMIDCMDETVIRRPAESNALPRRKRGRPAT
jgi:hypothetical protein